MRNKEIIEYNITDTKLIELAELHPVITIQNNKDLATVKESISVVRDIRVSIEKRRKELKKDSVEYGRNVDKKASEITVKLLQIEKPLKEEKEVYESEKLRIALEKKEKEQARIDKIQDHISHRRNYPYTMRHRDAEDINKAIIRLQGLEDFFDYQEFTQSANQVKEAALHELVQLGLEVSTKEKEAAELEVKRIELEKQQAILKADRDAMEAERVKAQVQVQVDAEAQRVKLEQHRILETQKAEEKKLADKRRRIEEKRKIAPAPAPAIMVTVLCNIFNDMSTTELRNIKTHYYAIEDILKQVLP